MESELLTELQNEFNKESLISGTKYLILSRGRARTITSHKLFSFAEVIVPVSEKQDYEYKLKKEVLTYPDHIHGLSVLRNYVLRTFNEEIIIMINDDIKKILNIEHNIYTIIESPDDIKRLLDSTAQITKDLDKSLFGYKLSEDIRSYTPTSPFAINSWVGSVIGVVGRKFRFDEHNILKTDIDYSLQCLLHDRIVIKDNRYAFVSEKISNTGGNSSYRTRDKVESEKMYLKRKWGKHIKMMTQIYGERTAVNVTRKSTL